jgi:DNA relaxase NicK
MQVQLSGERAQENWFMVHSSNAHVSRMDVQVTAQWTVMPPHLGYAAREDARRKNAERTEKRRRKIAVHEDDEGGYTLYVGSALSEQFGRLYNKEVESKGVYARSWRFEVVLRNSHATEMARYLALHSHQMTRMETFVADWFAERGIAVPWERGEYTVPRMAPAREKPESEKALQWLMTQVAPTVRWLHNHYDRATLEKALMLGVEPLAYSTGQEGGDEYAEPDS